MPGDIDASWRWYMPFICLFALMLHIILSVKLPNKVLTGHVQAYHATRLLLTCTSTSLLQLSAHILIPPLADTSTPPSYNIATKSVYFFEGHNLNTSNQQTTKQ